MRRKWTTCAAIVFTLLTGCTRVGTAEPNPSPSTAPPSTPAPSATTPQTLQEAFQRIKSGVTRLEVATCTKDFVGSGFEVGPDLVVTAAHVVRGAQVIRVIQGVTAMAGVVIGIDEAADVALIQTNTQLQGTQLDFTDRSVQEGDQIAAIGFPEGDPLTYNEGTVNGIGRKAVIEGIARHDLIVVDAATQHGSSGGPIVRADGSVVGLVDAEYDGLQGRRLVVSSTIAEPLVDEWRNSPATVTPEDCSQVMGPDGAPLPADKFPTGETAQVFATLQVYFASINKGDFSTAVAQRVAPGSEQIFKEGVGSSQDTDFVTNDVTREDSKIIVWMDFTSRQDPGDGPADRPSETCTRWSLEYVMAQANGLWLIEGTREHAGVPPNQPC